MERDERGRVKRFGLDERFIERIAAVAPNVIQECGELSGYDDGADTWVDAFLSAFRTAFRGG